MGDETRIFCFLADGAQQLAEGQGTLCLRGREGGRGEVIRIVEIVRRENHWFGAIPVGAVMVGIAVRRGEGLAKTADRFGINP
jgi:hypothetical protein